MGYVYLIIFDKRNMNIINQNLNILINGNL